MENVSDNTFKGVMKSAEEIAKQREMAKAAYALLGMELPEKAEKVRKSATGRKYKTGYRDLVDNGRKVRIEDLAPVEAPVVDAESMARTFRAYIAYKIGHTLKEVLLDTGKTCFYFKNRITKSDKSLEVENMSDMTAWEYVAAFYKDCLAEITDKWGIFQTADGMLYMLAVKAGHYHIVQVAQPEK